MFKECFKFYKQINSLEQQLDVIDFANEVNTKIMKPKKLTSEFFNNDKEILDDLGLKSDLSDWNCYDVLNVPGLIFIKNPFTSTGQKYWMKRCIVDYTRKPNRLNIDAHHIIGDGEDWWTTTNKLANGNVKLRDSLRWATLGYHHNWDTKVYSETAKSEFPIDLFKLSKTIINLLQFPDEFMAEAGIVNFYHPSSTLSGHTDHSEYNLSAPLLSISFGLSAIFLIGGRSLDDKPSAILLRSGDVIVMSKESRLCYHGVPKVLLPKNDQHFNYNNELEDPFKSFMQVTRININVRQVNNIV
ncbi:nucleic acid dioxygenase ALKBH1 [Metopolophium dirhodum]|uniref:nucleic acid dioxygenase ALKBH1 n=1 Tax=Metopolophium dirhodum TaxID=44670 RepID=UPI00298F43F2|nr:nucleic acid dioxygenase ALKBH1 [Metopolophium dirhodum]